MNTIRKIPQTITKEEFEELIRITLQKGKTDSPKLRFLRFRNAMMFMFGYFMGLRPKEIRDIKLEYIDLEKRSLFIPEENSKQRQSDLMPIPEILFHKLKIYLKLRGLFYKTEWLFPSCTGRINRSTFAKLIKNKLKKAEIYREGLCPYSLRHSFGTNCFMKLRDLKETSIMLRHKDLMMRTTARYIHCCENRLREEIMQDLYSKAK